MRHRLSACVMTIALIGSAGHAMAQAPSETPTIDLAHPKFALSAQQKQAVEQGLKSEAPQSSAAGAQAEIGTVLPSSLTALPMPNGVVQQVPEAKNYKFVKLASRVLVVDPVDRTIAEIIPLQTTTGAASH
jgi:hypothetical protein